MRAKEVNNDDSDNFGGLYTALCGYDYLLMKAVLEGQETYRPLGPSFLPVALILYVCESIVKVCVSQSKYGQGIKAVVHCWEQLV